MRYSNLCEDGICHPGGGGGALLYLGVLGMCRWTGCFFVLPELAQGAFLSFQLWAPDLACILLISQACISRISSLILVSQQIVSKFHKQI